eukprot:Nk52_evm12s359 gene=Nk52_evmTU12s359
MLSREDSLSQVQRQTSLSQRHSMPSIAFERGDMPVLHMGDVSTNISYQQQCQDAVNDVAVNSNNLKNNGLYKTELCHSFEETNFCKYGDKCKFAHGRGELRRVSRHPKYKTDLCKTFHTVGTCPYGTRCHFIHNLDEVGKEFNQYVTESSSNSRTQSVSSSTSPPMPEEQQMHPLTGEYYRNGYGNGQMIDVSRGYPEVYAANGNKQDHVVHRGTNRHSAPVYSNHQMMMPVYGTVHHSHERHGPHYPRPNGDINSNETAAVGSWIPHESHALQEYPVSWSVGSTDIPNHSRQNSVGSRASSGETVMYSSSCPQQTVNIQHDSHAQYYYNNNGSFIGERGYAASYQHYANDDEATVHHPSEHNIRHLGPADRKVTGHVHSESLPRDLPSHANGCSLPVSMKPPNTVAPVPTQPIDNLDKGLCVTEKPQSMHCRSISLPHMTEETEEELMDRKKRLPFFKHLAQVP